MKKRHYNQERPKGWQANGVSDKTEPRPTEQEQANWVPNWSESKIHSRVWHNKKFTKKKLVKIILINEHKLLK